MNIKKQLHSSVKERGLIRSLELFYSRIIDYGFDIRYGLHTFHKVKLDDLTIQSENKQWGVDYMPTGVLPFKKLMKEIDFPKESVFVDVGCGKGRLLLLASQYGFKKILGIEFSHQLYEEAKKNIAQFQKKNGKRLNIDLIESDVVDYVIESNQNVFFLYNPFSAQVMTRFLENIKTSLHKKYRKIWLIYHYPACQNIIEKQNIFIKTKDYILAGNPYAIYVNDNGQ
jgi:SAM-dependent methyltransferase